MIYILYIYLLLIFKYHRLIYEDNMYLCTYNFADRNIQYVIYVLCKGPVAFSEISKIAGV